MLKFYIQYLIFIFLHIFYLFPINKNKIYFRSFHGKSFSCNPKYLYLYIKHTFNNKYKCIWEVEKSQDEYLQDNTVAVRTRSLSSIFHMMTSKYVITNSDRVWWIPLRKKQILLETWHGGGAYKKVGIYEHGTKVFRKEQRLSTARHDFYISSSEKFSQVQAPSKNIPSSCFINTGMPRNEIFFNKSYCDEISENVRVSFGLKNNEKIILYAPTYRGLSGYKNQTDDYGEPDYHKLLVSLQKRFGGNWVVFYRSHYFETAIQKEHNSKIIDATKYPDMQELLCTADVLLTDYSSSMWDFSCTNKPCFLYVPDFDQYNCERGFYTDPKTWPFSMATNDNELCENIQKFDEKDYKILVEKHHTDFLSFENANASKKVCDLLGIF